MLTFSLKAVVLLLSVLIGTAFVTLLERKALGYMQVRKGPNTVGHLGILQPIGDAVKLFSNSPMHLSLSSRGPHYLGPTLSLAIMLIIWASTPSTWGGFGVESSLLLILCCFSAGVYPTLLAGWSANSKYSLLGSLRAVAQTVSYEVSLAFILLGLVSAVASFSLEWVGSWGGVWFLLLAPPLSLMWLITLLAELNRTPFDLSEGESELVSGFNTEYAAGAFALFFLAEYGSILFMGALFCHLFLGGEGLPISATSAVFLFIWVRASLPRIRYDKLMSVAWTILLPSSLSYLVFFLGIKSLATL